MDEKLLIGRRIKRLRSRLGLTQDQLAENVHISPKYLSNIERGKENPTLDTLLRLTKSLKVETWEVFFLDSEQPTNTKTQRKMAAHLLEEVSDEQLGVVMRLLRAALH
jgi:transcriptional regulator with XRE-family HTH domain